MKAAHFLIAPLLLLAALSSSLAQITWAFHPSEPGPEGLTSAYATFVDGKNEVKFILPTLWEFSDDKFVPPGNKRAFAFVEKSPIEGAKPWTPERIKITREETLARIIPNGATKVTVSSETQNLPKLCGLETYEIAVSYLLYGSGYVKSVLFVEHDKSQLRFCLDTRKEDFVDIHNAFLGSLFLVTGIK